MHRSTLFDELAGKSVCITGATGSFGRHITKELVRQGSVEHLTVFSRDEERQRLLGLQLLDLGASRVRTSFVLGDVRNVTSLRRALRNVDVVINAAAIKQVPASELNAIEAVHTNILGMQNVLDAASDNGVAQVLTISTDKAVEPINTMGISKAMQERLVQSHALQNADNRVTVVRYGNVLGSTGSVLPVFVDQALRTGEITVTHPSMTRFLLTLDDALGLVSTALSGEEATGTTYVRHAPAVTVQQMADVVRGLFGRTRDISIRVIGPRPGDKAHEVLVSQDEMRRSVRRGDSFIIPPVSAMAAVVAGREDGLAVSAFSSDVAPVLPSADLEELVREWCHAHGLSP